jgi:hypothetical protein
MLLTTTDGTDAWARNRRSEQLARKERDWAALLRVRSERPVHVGCQCIVGGRCGSRAVAIVLARDVTKEWGSSFTDRTQTARDRADGSAEIHRSTGLPERARLYKRHLAVGNPQRV